MRRVIQEQLDENLAAESVSVEVTELAEILQEER